MAVRSVPERSCVTRVGCRVLSCSIVAARIHFQNVRMYASTAQVAIRIGRDGELRRSRDVPDESAYLLIRSSPWLGIWGLGRRAPKATRSPKCSTRGDKAKQPTPLDWLSWYCFGSRAGWTGLEPAASGVTGRRYNRLNYHPKFVFRRLSLRRFGDCSTTSTINRWSRTFFEPCGRDRVRTCGHWLVRPTLYR